MMILPELYQNHMRTFFGHLADHGMVDSPDGPLAQQMRDYTKKTELTEAERVDVYQRANGRLALYGDLLRQKQKIDRSRHLLTSLFVATPDQDTMLERVDRELRFEHPRLPVTRAAAALVSLLARPDELHPS